MLSAKIAERESKQGDLFNVSSITSEAKNPKRLIFYENNQIYINTIEYR
jgi:hypothetical protein